jgi:hypothetical protein
MFNDSDLIFAYSRKQALADGVLVDASATAREAGIRYPVALTRAVWDLYVQVPPGVEAQDEAGRLWDILWTLRHGIRAAQGDGPTLHYRLHVRNTNGRPRLVTLRCACGPDDDGSPCLTIMLPDED